MEQTQQRDQQEMGAGGVPKGGCFIPGNPVFSCQVDMKPVKVDYHQTDNECFQGYPQNKSVHPLYRTTNSDIGGRAPTVHTAPTVFNARTQKFTGHLGPCGMYRNHSLNCAMDKSNF